MKMFFKQAVFTNVAKLSGNTPDRVLFCEIAGFRLQLSKKKGHYRGCFIVRFAKIEQVSLRITFCFCGSPSSPVSTNNFDPKGFSCYYSTKKYLKYFRKVQKGMGQIILETSWLYTQAVTQRCCVTKVLIKLCKVHRKIP